LSFRFRPLLEIMEDRTLLATFLVSTTADSGPGSLRQAILNSNAATGDTNTIDFAVPGAGVQTITPFSPLPAITKSVVIDGTTESGFAGAPLIAIGGQSQGGLSPLSVSAGDVTVRGLAVDGLTIEATASVRFFAIAHAPGAASQLSLFDSGGTLLVSGNAASALDPDRVIDEHLAAGVYSVVASGPGQDNFTLTMMLTADAAAPFQPIPGGQGPSSIVAGDFTQSGHLDLAVADEGSDEISILLGNGDGTFQPAVQYPVAGSPTAITAGDFTGDGKLDLAVADSSSNEVSVLLGNGDGTFQQPVQYAVETDPVAIVAGDFGGNGRVDLAVACQGDDPEKNTGLVSVLLGNGNGTFQRQIPCSVGNGPDAIATGDFEDDGRIDLAVANFYSGNVTIISGQGGGAFQTLAIIPVPFATPAAIVAGDFGTGQVDLAVVDSANEIVDVFFGSGNGTFQFASFNFLVPSPCAIVAEDFGNGQVDLATADTNADLVSVLLGNGNGTFQPEVDYYVGSNPAAAIAAGDFFGNDRLDLAVVNASSVSLLFGSGVGSFEEGAPNEFGYEPVAMATGDFTGNGHLGVAVLDLRSNSVTILPGNGDGTLQQPLSLALPYGSEATAIVAADFNDDGRTDLAIAEPFFPFYGSDGAFLSEGAVLIYLGNGDGTFDALPPISVPYANALAAGEFTGNGRIDLAVGDGGQGGVTILMGNGDGTFTDNETVAPSVFLGGLGQQPLVAGDFGNGHIDLAVADEATNDVIVLMNNGHGGFTAQPPIPLANGSSFFTHSLVAGNFTDSGYTDLAVTTDDNEASVELLVGQGNGKFKPLPPIPLGFSVSPFAIVAGYFNKDGDLDLATANYGGGGTDDFSVLTGDGLGGFSGPFPYGLGGPGPAAMVAGNFTGDGQTDLAIAGTSPDDVEVRLSNPNGTGTFVTPAEFATAPHATPLLADVTGDGTDSVLVVDAAGKILYRQGIPGQPGAFEPPVTVNPPLSDGSNPFLSSDVAWLPNTDQGPVLASLDTEDDAIWFYAYRDGGFVQLRGAVITGELPAQIIGADFTGNGLTDLIVRNAGDGTLSLYLGTTVVPGNSGGGVDSEFASPDFLPPVTLPVGLGVSDVQAARTTGDGRLDVVVTNQLTAQMSVLFNLGDGHFSSPVPFRAGTGMSKIDPSDTPEISSLDATSGVAAGPLSPGGPTDLVTINPGSNTLDVLAGLGNGEFAYPVAIETLSQPLFVRVGDFSGNGIGDLAVLTANGLSIYLGNGDGGFLPPTTYAVPPNADGLTVADLRGTGKLDLLVGDASGDVLVFTGNGNGTFQPYHEANQTIELAVTDLSGNGSKDIIYADQGLDRVVVDYGTGNSAVLASQSTGLLAPGAVALADLNGDNIPDLMVANSGSNNVLIYPGLGNGQFGPAVNDGNGYFVGTNPVGITAAKLTGILPDLVVADEGSNQVSILINQGDFQFTAGPRLNSGGDGPVSTLVEKLAGNPYPDILVTNSLSNDVALVAGVGQGFFNDQSPQTFPVGSDPGPTFVGNFNGALDLVTVNNGSNNITLISNFDGPAPVTTTIPSGGIDPETAFAFSSSSGFDDLVVGNTGDGVLALFEGGDNGLTLAATANEPNLPSPTALAFSALTGGQVQFYAASAGREAAELVSLTLSVETVTGNQSPTPLSGIAQLVSLSESSLPLGATVLTLTIALPGDELGLGTAGSEAAAVASISPGPGVSLGQGFLGQGRGPSSTSATLPPSDSGEDAAVAVPAALAPWQRFVLGQDEAIEKFQRDNPNGLPPSNDATPATSQPAARPSASAPAPTQAEPATSDSTRRLFEPECESAGAQRHEEHQSAVRGVRALDQVIESMWSDSALRGTHRVSVVTEQLVDVPTEHRPALEVVFTDLMRRVPQDVAIAERGKQPVPWISLASTESWHREMAPVAGEASTDESSSSSVSLLALALAGEWALRRRAARYGKDRAEIIPDAAKTASC
jgi:hypothetical protein